MKFSIDIVKLFKISTLNIVKSYDRKCCSGVSKTHCIFDEESHLISYTKFIVFDVFIIPYSSGNQFRHILSKVTNIVAFRKITKSRSELTGLQKKSNFCTCSQICQLMDFLQVK